MWKDVYLDTLLITYCHVYENVYMLIRTIHRFMWLTIDYENYFTWIVQQGTKKGWWQSGSMSSFSKYRLIANSSANKIQ